MGDGDAAALQNGRRLALPDDLGTLPPGARPVAGAVDLALHADDGMYAPGDDLHYLQCGASALNIIRVALLAAGTGEPRTILDFGSGAGRVTRWLRAGFPRSAIECCDLRAADLDFCRAHFGAATWVSGTDVEALAAPRRYDLIWLGSVFTHLSAGASRALLAKVLGWAEPGGLVIASTIGRAGKARQERDGQFIHPEGWAEIDRAFAETGFGYSDYWQQQGYGLSLIKPSWVSRLIETTEAARLVLLCERAWDDLHDIVAVQRDATVAGLATAASPDARDTTIAALEARIAALESSTSWRITAPLRRLAGRMR